MTNSLKGQVALVTGSGRGMGRSHAMLLAERGADVIVHDRNGQLAEQTVDELTQRGHRAHLMIADVRCPRTLADEIGRTAAESGDISILVNNAGISGRGLTIEQIDEDTFDDVFTTHVRGTFFAAQAVLPGMKRRGYGRIINIASNFALVGYHTMSHYAAAKAAILGLTRSWAREFGTHGITVNAVAPGTVETEMTRSVLGKVGLEAMARTTLVGRLAELSEVSYLIAWLASKEAAMITGQTLSPDGGQSIGGK